mmetsp:Transcript_49875/g.116385  ORF Transcript_49875/g.116385 Transcript_49875/m.116385 type:complete len:243 (-) Transcript_49875:1667-2395(-)
MPPAGKCTWTSSPLKGSFSGGLSSFSSTRAGLEEADCILCVSKLNTSADWPWQKRTKRPRRRDKAVSTLSVITFPSCPVTVSFPVPTVFVASMKRSWPPTADTLSPMATPTSSRSARSGSKCSTPRIWGKWSACTLMRPSASGPLLARPASRTDSRPRPVGTSRLCSLSAAHRQIWAKWRSSDRTPLSAVHRVTSASKASEEISRRGGPACSPSLGSSSKACSLRCFGSRWLLAIATFSSTV